MSKKEPTNIVGNITIQNARLAFRNFSGRETTYNKKGEANFCILLDDELAEVLHKDGWNVKSLKPREEGDSEQPYLKVSVSFKYYGPYIMMISSTGMTQIDAVSLPLLDVAEFSNVDLIIRPYHWEVGGKTGIKAFLKTMYGTIIEDELTQKYQQYRFGVDDEPSEDDIPF